MTSPTTFNYFQAITKSDTVAIQTLDGNPPQAIFVGTGGDIIAVNTDGSTATIKAATGSLLPFAPYRINSTNTTAAAMVGCWTR